MNGNKEDGASGGRKEETSTPDLLHNVSADINTGEITLAKDNNKEDDASGGRKEDSRSDPPQNASAEGKDNKIKNLKKCKNQVDEVVHYCYHCGNVVVAGPDIYCTDCESLKKTLDDVTNKFSKVKRYQNLMLLGIHVEHLRGKGNKRKLKRQELRKKVSALLNTGSGHILIHLVGFQRGKEYIAAFHIFVDETLDALINDGRQFTEVYKKKILSESSDFSNNSDFVVLTVEESDKLLTSDFKTKYATDVNIKQITEEGLRRFLRDKTTFKTDHHQFDFETLKEIPDPSLHENREVQLKELGENKKGDEWLVNHILGNLKLPHYISAFSKVSTGGSYVAGVGECDEENEFSTNPLFYKPAIVKDQERFKTLLQTLLKEKCLVCDYEGNIEDVDDLVKTTLVPKKDGQHPRNQFIIVVSARPVRGLVFHDSDGPVAYVISEKNQDSILDSIERLPFKKWFERMRPN